VLSLRKSAPVPFADEPSNPGLTPVVASFSGVASPSSQQELLESLERYKLVARLGQGGMAEVYLAAWEVAPFVHRPVVIKRLHPHFNEDTRLVQMFLDEARLLTQLDHPNVVKTLEAGVIDGRCCIAMEYLEGQPLHRVLRRAYQHGGLAPELAVSIAISVLDGLHYSHATTGANGQPLEIVHRDVSPQNVFVTNDGQVKVLDFGIAKANTQEGRTATGIIKGKVGYIAPEQAKAEVVDRRADIWSVGVVLWEALAGARLFKADTDAATLGMCLQGEIPTAGSRRPDLPIELDVVLARALQRDRTKRYQTAGAMRKDLEQWLARAGYSRDARTIGALMRMLFSGEIVEQQRLVSVLMARSDCTPPAPSSNRVPSSTSALIMSSPSPATSADLTRVNAELTELGLRHRRAFRSVLVLLALFATFAIGVGHFAFTKLKDSRPGPVAAALATPPANVDVHAPADESPPTAPKLAADTAVQLAQSLPKPLRVSASRIALKEPAPAEVATTPTLAPSVPKPEAAPSFGFLTIDTSPWSLVSIGGRPLGQTPLMNVKLPAGSQVLSLRNPEQGIETSYPVTIESGKTTVRRIGIE
jgi:eukaryotic-like serine/threonine-protein kinase